jgi:hypothetical protein
MRLGISSLDGANFYACVLENWGDPFGREAWCSETISYWHRQAEIPYSGGYRDHREETWLLDWQLPNTSALRTFYQVEEEQRFPRGRWIDWSDLDYGDFQPGVNGPLPGAYVCIRCYTDHGDGTGDWSGGHSMMVDEMTIYQTVGGAVDRVHIVLLEGNTAVGVNYQRYMDDILAVTPYGSGYFDDCDNADGMKILGFGIDLNGLTREPIYDESRLHYEIVPATAHAAPLESVRMRDPIWDQHYAPLIPKLVDYADKVLELGINVQIPAEWAEISGIPDGTDHRWNFPLGAAGAGPQTVEIDLLDVHPLLVKGIVLGWHAGFIPEGYQVQWAGADQVYHDTTVPSFEGVEMPEDEDFVVPVPIMFGESGARVRYVKLVFPQGTFRQGASLEELRFIYDWGPDQDVPLSPAESRVTHPTRDPDAAPTTGPDATPTIGPAPSPATCPNECLCLAETEGEELGLGLCAGARTLCGSGASGAPRLCYEKPPRETECPADCPCLTKAEADQLGLVLCQGKESVCGHVEGTDLRKHCYEKPVAEAVCPSECLCLAEAEGKKLGLAVCNGTKTACGTDPSGAPRLCYEKPPRETKCPADCPCLTKAEAEQLGLVLCQGKEIVCGHVESTDLLKYCYEKLLEGTQCPASCLCRTVAQARELGLELCGDERTPCGTDAAGAPRYCYLKPERSMCPVGCSCLTDVEAKSLGKELCQDESIVCGQVEGADAVMHCYE